MKSKKQCKGMIIPLVCLISLVSIIFSSFQEAESCDIAVVSAKASATGRPFIWKNRDEPSRWEQEMKYYDAETDEAGAYICIIDRTKLVAIPSGGLNEAGFAIANTTVYERDPIHEYIANANTDLLIYALQHCTTVESFDELLANWHLDSGNNTKVISGNFVVIDANGGAALYECYTGEGIAAYTAPIDVNKFDANTAKDENGNFLGFVNRTNSHEWIPLKNDTCREWRGMEVLKELRDEGKLDYKNAMRFLARDVNKWDYENHFSIKETGKALSETDRQEIENDENLNQVNTTYSVSRAETNISLVVDGAAPGEDPRLCTIWANMGEPSIGIFTPHFPFAGKLTYYVWADNPLWRVTPRNLLPTCLLNQLFVYNAELSMYDNNGWGLIQIDWTVNYTKLRNLQQWTFPLEDIIISRTEEFLADMYDNPSLISAENMYEFSHYSAAFGYDCYADKKDGNGGWDYNKPRGGSWKGKTRPVADSGTGDDNNSGDGNSGDNNTGDDNNSGSNGNGNPGDDNSDGGQGDDFQWDKPSDGSSAYEPDGGGGCGNAAYASSSNRSNGFRAGSFMNLILLMIFISLPGIIYRYRKN